MNQRNDWVYFFIAFVVLPVIYILYRSLPDITFLFVPFVIVSWLLGQLWRFLCETKPVCYRPVAGMMAVSIGVLAATIGFPRDPLLIGKDNVRIESSFLFKIYNNFQRSIDESINSTWISRFRSVLPGLIPPKEYAAKPFGHGLFAWSLWLAVCLGAPVVFLFYAKKEDLERIREIEETAKKEVRRQKERRLRLRHLQRSDRAYYQRKIHDRDVEIKRLNDLVASISIAGGPPPPAGRSDPKPPDPGGIFGSNDF